LTEDTFIDATGKVFGLQGLDITALDASADGASTGYTLLVVTMLQAKVSLATTLIQVVLQKSVSKR
jgi:hypothetical protein